MRGIAGHGKRAGKGLVVAQVALVLLLLIGTGLLLRSYANVLAVRTGFSASAEFERLGEQKKTARE